MTNILYIFIGVGIGWFGALTLTGYFSKDDRGIKENEKTRNFRSCQKMRLR